MLKRFLPGLMLLGFVLIFSACGSGSTSGSGGGGGYAAPLGATISVFPASHSVAHQGGSSYTRPYEFTIVVRDENGIPMEDVYLHIHSSQAQPGATLLEFMDGGNSTNSPMSVTTDQNGAYTLTVKFLFGGTLEYSGNILITSGGASAAMPYEVTLDTS